MNITDVSVAQDALGEEIHAAIVKFKTDNPDINLSHLGVNMYPNEVEGMVTSSVNFTADDGSTMTRNKSYGKVTVDTMGV